MNPIFTFVYGLNVYNKEILEMLFSHYILVYFVTLDNICLCNQWSAGFEGKFCHLTCSANNKIEATVTTITLLTKTYN